MSGKQAKEIRINWLDITIVALIAGGAFFGWRNGVLRWVLTLAGAIVGAIVAGQLYDQFQAVVPGVDSQALRQVIAFVVILMLFMTGAWLLARAVKTVLNVLLLGWIDNVAGLAIGVLVGVLAASAISSIAAIVPSEAIQSAVGSSLLAESLLEATSFIRAFLPSEFDVIMTLF